MEVATFVLVLCLAAVLTVYNRRQAQALEYMARLEEDRTAREIRERREKARQALQIQPLRWLEGMIEPLLTQPLSLTSLKRCVPEVGAAEIEASDGRRLVVSTQPLTVLRRYDRRVQRSRGKGVSARLADFASQPLLKGRRVWSVSRSMAEAGEFFDLEAEACGKALGLDWGAPTRLYFYVLR